MPRETVGLRGGIVSVGWSKGAAQAQIGVQRFTDGSDATSGALESHPSLFIDFAERRQVNELIRKLRNARDDAFGRDE